MQVENGFDRFLYHPVYVALVLFAVFPINIYFILNSQVLLGMILLTMQLPWLLQGLAGKFHHTLGLLGIR